MLHTKRSSSTFQKCFFIFKCFVLRIWIQQHHWQTSVTTCELHWSQCLHRPLLAKFQKAVEWRFTPLCHYL